MSTQTLSRLLLYPNKTTKLLRYTYLWTRSENRLYWGQGLVLDADSVLPG